MRAGGWMALRVDGLLFRASGDVILIARYIFDLQID